MKKSNKKSLKNAMIAVVVLLLLCVITGLLVTFLKIGDDINPGETPDEKTDTTGTAVAEIYQFGKELETSSEVTVYLGQNDFAVTNVTDWNVTLSVTKDATFDYIAGGKYYSFTYSDFVKSFVITKYEDKFSITVGNTILGYITDIRETTDIVLPDDAYTQDVDIVLTLTSGDKKYDYAVKTDFEHYPISDIDLDKTEVVF